MLESPETILAVLILAILTYAIFYPKDPHAPA